MSALTRRAAFLGAALLLPAAARAEYRNLRGHVLRLRAGENARQVLNALFENNGKEAPPEGGEEGEEESSEVLAKKSDDALEAFLQEQKVPRDQWPKVRKRLGEVWSVLSGIGVSMGGDESVQFRVGPWWMTDRENKTVYFPIHDVVKNLDNIDPLIGGAAHEAGHVFWTRWDQLPHYKQLLDSSEFPAADHFLFNLLEDIYQEQAMGKRWPGLPHYLKALIKNYDPEKLMKAGKDAQKNGSPPMAKPLPFEEYLKVILESYRGTGAYKGRSGDELPDPKKIENKKVREAMEQSMDALKRLRDMTPENGNLSEDDRIREAFKRFEVVKNDILPIYRKLVEESKDELKKQQQQQKQGKGKQSQNGGGGGGSGGMNQPPPPPGTRDQKQEKSGKNDSKDGKGSQGQKDKKQDQEGGGSGQEEEGEQQEDGEGMSDEEAKKIIEDRAKQADEKLSPTHGKGEEQEKQRQQQRSQGKDSSVSLDPGRRGREGKNRVNAPPGATAQNNDGDIETLESITDLLKQHEGVLRHTSPKNSYEETLAKVEPLLDGFTGRLENLFQKNTRTTWEGYFRTGQRVSVRKWIKSESRGWTQPRDFKVFERKKLPTRRDYKFRLLIDVSGSMAGERMELALQTSVLFMEVLERLGIDYSIMGFSDSVVLFKEFSGDPVNIKKLTHDEKKGLVHSIANQNGGATYDTEAVMMALQGGKGIQGLEEQGGEWRYLIVITDGEGNGAASARMDQALARAESKQVGVIGIGVGAGMSYVAQRYPRHILEPTLHTVPEAVGDILEKVILEGFVSASE